MAISRSTVDAMLRQRLWLITVGVPNLRWEILANDAISCIHTFVDVPLCQDKTSYNTRNLHMWTHHYQHANEANWELVSIQTASSSCIQLSLGRDDKHWNLMSQTPSPLEVMMQKNSPSLNPEQKNAVAKLGIPEFLLTGNAP